MCSTHGRTPDHRSLVQEEEHPEPPGPYKAHSGHGQVHLKHHILLRYHKFLLGRALSIRRWKQTLTVNTLFHSKSQWVGETGPSPGTPIPQQRVHCVTTSLLLPTPPGSEDPPSQCSPLFHPLSSARASRCQTSPPHQLSPSSAYKRTQRAFSPLCKYSYCSIAPHSRGQKGCHRAGGGGMQDSCWIHHEGINV